jgi:hypothetical protein
MADFEDLLQQFGDDWSQLNDQQRKDLLVSWGAGLSRNNWGMQTQVCQSKPAHTVPIVQQQHHQHTLEDTYGQPPASTAAAFHNTQNSPYTPPASRNSADPLAKNRKKRKAAILTPTSTPPPFNDPYGAPPSPASWMNSQAGARFQNAFTPPPPPPPPPQTAAAPAPLPSPDWHYPAADWAQILQAEPTGPVPKKADMVSRRIH